MMDEAIIYAKILKEYAANEVLGEPESYGDEMKSLLRGTNGEVSPSEVGHMLSRYGYNIALEAYASYYYQFSGENDASDDKSRFGWIKTYCEHQHKEREMVDYLKRRKNNDRNGS